MKLPQKRNDIPTILGYPTEPQTPPCTNFYQVVNLSPKRVSSSEGVKEPRHSEIVYVHKESATSIIMVSWHASLEWAYHYYSRLTGFLCTLITTQ